MAMTVREALARGAGQLAAHPVLRERALADAALLLMHMLGVGRAELIAHPERGFSLEDQRAYQAAIERRLRFEPVQYIVGEQEFYGLPFRVSAAVLIPRPETELLVEAVLARVAGFPDPVRIVDVGTGSGAIAVALATHLPEAQVTGVDVSLASLLMARENALRNGASVRFLESDLLTAVANEKFAVVVANPPYVPTGDAEEMHPEVREYEPRLALFAGESGMEVYERLVPAAWEVLTPGGLLAVEIGFGQRKAVSGLLAGWSGVEVLQDLRGVDRVLVGYRSLS